jgi:hypothetical protein
MTYEIEFPDFPEPLPHIEGFIDTSWHNDACPSLGKEITPNNWLTVFVDYLNPDLREIGHCRYALIFNEDGGKTTELCDSDNLDEIKQSIDQFLKGLTQ